MFCSDPVPYCEHDVQIQSLCHEWAQHIFFGKRNPFLLMMYLSMVCFLSGNLVCFANQSNNNDDSIDQKSNHKYEKEDILNNHKIYWIGLYPFTNGVFATNCTRQKNEERRRKRWGNRIIMKNETKYKRRLWNTFHHKSDEILLYTIFQITSNFSGFVYHQFGFIKIFFLLALLFPT